MILSNGDQLMGRELRCMLDDLLEQTRGDVKRLYRVALASESVPPGIIRSAPAVSFGMTAAGVERNGSNVGCFHKVYTVSRLLSKLVVSSVRQPTYL